MNDEELIERIINLIFKEIGVEVGIDLKRIIIKKEKEINQLQSNWNSLREWLEDEKNQQYSKFIPNYSINNWVLDKMNELERKDK